MRIAFWKGLVVLWITGVLVAAFAVEIPRLPILEQSARNLYFHVPMWFTMILGFGLAVWYSLRYLLRGRTEDDLKAEQAARVAVLFGVLGLLTGSLWARFTWGAWWNWDPKQTLALAQLLLLGAYFALRSAVEEERRRARLSAAYAFLALLSMPFLLFIVPRQLPSLHPGAEGNPAFDEITAPQMRVVFYAAVLGFLGLFAWLFELSYRQARLRRLLEAQREQIEEP
ncbi:MAG: cytochrome c biogenesis protein CcsA [Bacteroidota bacterium]|nr:cytochrome c biogenesis protein CcsA [Bacteroidota bacterium]MDW8137007.1 cytochrome c biogenesis protein CcsA [Bacteroidota bacterium]